ncbi:MAG TPA: DUF3037 domain-containing protein [Candidatus Angelobacter sp.]|nr:DUF3037 domain-containing protein [Candidatus Angelobacter sp.]
MATREKCSFFLLRYVPDAVKNEFVNIGLVLLPQGGEPELRFTHDWARVQCMDSEADVDLLKAMEAELRDQLRGVNGDRDSILRRIQDSFSNALQPSELKACMAESPAVEADTLARMYLDRHRPRGQGQPSSRQMIRQRIQQAFESVGVWQLMNKEIAAEKYTRKGDPLKIDCGYSPNGTVKLFHALAIETDPNSAKVLAFSYPRLSEGIAKLESKRAELTAITEDDLPREDEAVVFALETLEQQHIPIVRISQLPEISQTAARELRLI